MKILMIAPQPFFEPRGTPFSEFFRIQALTRLGHTVHLVTYPFGEDVAIPGLVIFRCRRPFFVHRVKTGPSLPKLVLDFFLFFKVWQRLRREKYDLLHSHEEASIMGVFFCRRFMIPHLYDMHSSLVQQMDNFQFTRLRPVLWIFHWLENVSLRRADAVIVICRSLQEYAARITVASKLFLIENFIDDTQADPATAEVDRTRRLLNPENKKLLLYAGTLEPYQGMPLLFQSMRLLGDEFHLVIAGGRQEQIDEYQTMVRSLGLAGCVSFLGQRPMAEIPVLLRAADVLVSPRSRGSNTPLKVYSCLRSGVPLVATNLYTHTQTLTADIALLAAAEPEKFAAAIRLAAGPEGKRIAGNAREFAARHYVRERYDSLVAEAMLRAVATKRPSRKSR